MFELYDIADGKAGQGPGDPAVVICVDEFGPLNLQPHPGKQWAFVVIGGTRRYRRSRRRATSPARTGHLMTTMASTDRLYGHVKVRKSRNELLGSVVTCGSASTRCSDRSGNFWPHLSTKKGPRVGEWAARTTSSSRTCRSTCRGLNRIAVHRSALLRARPHRPPIARSPEPHDPLHRLAEPQRPRPRTTRTCETCKRCLTRH